MDRLLCPWDFPGKNTGVGSHSFPSPWDLLNRGTELWSPAFCRQILYLLTHKALGIRKKKMGSIEDSGKHHQKIFKAFNTFLFTSIYFKIELHKISLGPWLSVSFFGWRKYTLERLNDLPKVTQLFCGTIRLRNQVS